MGTINTTALASAYRAQVVDTDLRRVLLARIAGSDQESDLTLPTNCEGFGRVRHFRRHGSSSWPPNPLPIDPATHALCLNSANELQAQVFQLAACSWRCWYCFVPDALLSANKRASAFVSIKKLVDLYLNLTKRPKILDLSGGQPDLVPEWPLWVIRELRSRDAERHAYVWSDDNLSNDYYWRLLADQDREELRSFSNYGRVGCFKGFDTESFAFNTRASTGDYDTQFEVFRRLLQEGLDLYAYVTLTGPASKDIKEKIRFFIDRLQRIHYLLPLRTVPLKIHQFTPTSSRMSQLHRESLIVQQAAVEHWQDELMRRYSEAERTTPIHMLRMGPRHEA